ncbi:MAG: hypothetical protein M3N98_12915 [Actinomycetota bacterium]|nr:hypothetical protein [Actinomycetota bacterium]
MALSIMALSVALGQPASASGNAKPVTHVVGMAEPTTGHGETDWELVVNARDSDGIIWEVQVAWDDGAFTFADTFCVQGAKIGTPAHLRIPHPYATTGLHIVRTRAVSYSHCPNGTPVVEQVGPWTTSRVQIPG